MLPQLPFKRYIPLPFPDMNFSCVMVSIWVSSVLCSPAVDFRRVRDASILLGPDLVLLTCRQSLVLTMKFSQLLQPLPQ